MSASSKASTSLTLPEDLSELKFELGWNIGADDERVRGEEGWIGL